MLTSTAIDGMAGLMSGLGDVSAANESVMETAQNELEDHAELPHKVA